MQGNSSTIKLGAAGALSIPLALVLIPAVLITLMVSIFSIASDEESPNVSMPMTSEIPAELVPLFREAERAHKVNAYLLASVAKQESDFGNYAPAWQVNYAGCVGLMQICVGGMGGNTWGEPAVRYAYRKGRRPVRYPFSTPNHPNVLDAFDNVMGAAVHLRSKVGGVPIPKLDETAYTSLCGYFGACDWGGVSYAPTVLERAREWERAAMLEAGPGGVATGQLGKLAPGRTRIEQITNAANIIGAARVPYCYGGGHAPPLTLSTGSYCWMANGNQQYGVPDIGLDCSGAVRFLLAMAGYPDPGPTHSSAFYGKLEPGPGRWVTVWGNDAHVFVTIRGRGWGTCSANYRHGPNWCSHYTAGFVASHPPGL